MNAYTSNGVERQSFSFACGGGASLLGGLRRFLRPVMLGVVMLVSAGAAATEDSANVATLKRLYTAFGQGDVQTIAQLMSDKVEWVHPGPKTIPFAGTFTGHDGVQRFFQIAGERIEVQEQKLLGFVEQGDRVAVLGYERMKVRATGREYESNWVHLYTLRDARVVRFEEFIDTAALVEAFRQ